MIQSNITSYKVGTLFRCSSPPWTFGILLKQTNKGTEIFWFGRFKGKHITQRGFHLKDQYFKVPVLFEP